MKNIEIPLQPEKTKSYRWLERLPAILSWTMISLPFVLGLISPLLATLFIIAFILMWLVRAAGMNVRTIQGWRTIDLHKKLPWLDMLDDIEQRKVTAKAPAWHKRNIANLDVYNPPVKPSEAIQALVIATYNESRDVLEPTFKSILKSNYDLKKVIVMLAFEERGGPEVEAQAHDLIKEYGKHFLHAEALKHPKDIPDEVIGKGGNITFAARVLQKRLEERDIDPKRVLVTSLDADNRPDPNYFGALTYTFCMCAEPKNISFQPIPMFTNNIWDAPAPMRVIATGNSFWNVVLSLRPHMIRNFSSHAQTMDALIDTDFWSVRTIVEDGHQFWRTYFRYDGKHDVYPIYVPIYQDAVLADGYRRTLKAQFVQIRRWAYGASDIAYVIHKGYLSKNKVPRYDLFTKTFRLIEGHVNWAAAPLLITFSAFVPVVFNPESIAANQLPNIISNVMRVAMIGIIIALFMSLKTLPPKPARYKRRRTLWMVIQWAYLPITTIVYNSAAAINSQTRLFFGKYLDKFDVTEKAVKK